VFVVRAREGDQEAANDLVRANLRYAVAVALQYRRYGIKLADLVAEGNVGLMMAVRKFDPDRGTRFVTYAGYWIRAYILDCVVRSTSLVGAGAGPLRSKLFFRLRRERARVSNLEIDPEERTRMLAERFGVTPDKMRMMMRRLESRDVSLDQTVYDDSPVSLVETMPGAGDDQESSLAQSERKNVIEARLREAIGTLDRRERYIVEQRFLRAEERSLAAIGRELGVSRERARQLEARAKRKLREQLDDLH
jgi:RNA polymerase sigma-32 factor